MPLEFDGVNSKVSADKIQGQTGTTVTIESGHSLSGSGASLTNLPAANLTGTVADARISTLTASKLSGTIDGARLPDPLPAISGASLTNLPSHSGNVAFPATQVASADANTLDDYEEGTFTATISDGTNDATMSASAGVYTKIGRMVQAEIQIQVSSMGSVSGHVRIKGLPFNSANDGVYPGMAWGYGSSLALGAAGYGVNGFINPNTNYISLYTHDQTAGCTSLRDHEYTDGGQIFATINYHV